MSALGQKQTFAVQNGMSALIPIADMCRAQADVRFVPIADISGYREQLPTGVNRIDLERRPLVSSAAESSTATPVLH